MAKNPKKPRDAQGAKVELPNGHTLVLGWSKSRKYRTTKLMDGVHLRVRKTSAGWTSVILSDGHIIYELINEPTLPRAVLTALDIYSTSHEAAERTNIVRAWLQMPETAPKARKKPTKAQERQWVEAAKKAKKPEHEEKPAEVAHTIHVELPNGTVLHLEKNTRELYRARVHIDEGYLSVALLEGIAYVHAVCNGKPDTTTEYRSNPDQSPKVAVYEALLSYAYAPRPLPGQQEVRHMLARKGAYDDGAKFTVSTPSGTSLHFEAIGRNKNEFLVHLFESKVRLTLVKENAAWIAIIDDDIEHTPRVRSTVSATSLFGLGPARAVLEVMRRYVLHCPIRPFRDEVTRLLEPTTSNAAHAARTIAGNVSVEDLTAWATRHSIPPGALIELTTMLYS